MGQQCKSNILRSLFILYSFTTQIPPLSPPVLSNFPALRSAVK